MAIKFSCTRDSARQPRDANVRTGSLDYDVYPANGTRDATSQLSSPVSSQRLGHGKSSGGYTTLRCSTPPHSKCDTPSQLFTPDSQPRHCGSNFQAAQPLWRTVTCDLPSQLISLVLVTASLVLLRFEIPSRQAISIPKRKILRYRDIAIPLQASSNGSLLTLSKWHLLTSWSVV